MRDMSHVRRRSPGPQRTQPTSPPVPTPTHMSSCDHLPTRHPVHPNATLLPVLLIVAALFYSLPLQVYHPDNASLLVSPIQVSSITHPHILTTQPTHLSHGTTDRPDPIHLCRREEAPNEDTKQYIDCILGEELLARVHHLGQGPAAAYPINRPFLSSEGARARALILAYMRDAGMTAFVDGVGNVRGALECPSSALASSSAGDVSPPRKFVVLGSHHDTVVDGGLWDGAYGVLASIAVVKAVHSLGAATDGTLGVCSLPFDLHVVSFDDEEGNNPFGTTNLGAKAYAGLLGTDDNDAPPALSLPDGAAGAAFVSAHIAQFGDDDSDGGGVVDVRADDDRDGGGGTGEAAGADVNASRLRACTAPCADSQVQRVTARVRSAALDARERARVLAYVETHIEQGPVRGGVGAAAGAVSAIAGQTRMRVRFAGAAGHAGTVPMGMRRDALVPAARAVAEVERVGRAGAEQGLVATVGAVEVAPGGTNVVPGGVVFSVDVRAPEDEMRGQAVRSIVEFCEQEGRERGLEVVVETTHEVDAVVMTDWVREVVEQAVEEVDGGVQAAGGKVPVLPSGAGHDTQFMSKIAPVAMMFLRCKDGISHSPEEHVSAEDALTGARALLRTVELLAKK